MQKGHHSKIPSGPLVAMALSEQLLVVGGGTDVSLTRRLAST